MEIVGYYHSHPSGEAIPSRRDRDAAWPGTSYMIGATTDETVSEWRSWHLGPNGRLVEQANPLELGAVTSQVFLGEDGMSHGAHRPVAPLDEAELRRYSRHLVMPEVGREGQERLKAARVLIVGAGGLGSPVALYLAAAGVGTLGLVDFDEVDESNLQRQVIYGQSDIGRSKVAVAGQRALDPR